MSGRHQNPGKGDWNGAVMSVKTYAKPTKDNTFLNYHSNYISQLRPNRFLSSLNHKVSYFSYFPPYHKLPTTYQQWPRCSSVRSSARKLSAWASVSPSRLSIPCANSHCVSIPALCSLGTHIVAMHARPLCGMGAWTLLPWGRLAADRLLVGCPPLLPWGTFGAYFI